MRKFNMLIPALLGAFFFVVSGLAYASSGPDTYKNSKAEKGLNSAKYALSNLSLKSTLDFTSLPVSENWDADPAPTGWTYFTNSTEGVVEVQSSTYNSADYAVDFSNSSDETSDFILVSPGTTLDPAGTRVKFYAKANSMFPNPQVLKVGIMTDPGDPATYLNLSNNNLTGDWAEYIIDMSSVPPQSGTYYIAFKASFDGTNKHIYFDDFTWEEIPTSAILDYSPEEADFGMIFFGNSSADVDFTFSNYGINTIEVSSVVLAGTDAADFVISDISETLPFTLNANSANNLTVSVNCTPLTEGVKSATLDITTDLGVTSIPLSGESPEGLIQIGEGTETGTHLPMEPYYGYSYSQSIYLQSEINISDQRISKIYYQKNNQDDWEDAGQINIYLGHTTETTLSDYIDISNLQEVTYSETLPLADEDGWVEFVLTTPFIYNNTDNLVIAFDENKSSYDSDSDEFYNHTTADNKSIYYYNDSNNSDPTDPEPGTAVSSRPNIRLQFEDLPTVPVLSVNPDTYDYGTVIVSSSSDKDFSAQNTGIGNLTINDIYLGGTNMDQFVLSNLPTFPVSITNDPAEAFDITCSFVPTADGDVEAKIYFDTEQGLDSVMLSGNGYDATIYTLPWSEYFDDPATTTTPDMTLGWNSILNTISTYANIQTYTSSYYSTPNCVRFYNSDDASTEQYLILPPTSIPVSNIKAKAMIQGSSGLEVEAGVMTDNTDESTFIPVTSFTMTGTGSNYEQFEFYINSAAVTGTYYIAFRTINTSTYQYVYIDNVELEEVPVDATPVLSNNAWDAGQRPVGYTNSSDVFTLTNLGQTNLTISNITDLSSTPFSTTFVPGDVDIALNENYDFTFDFTPTAVGTFQDTFVIETSNGNDTVFLAGYCDYSLPADVVEIGWDTATNVNPNLPMEPSAVFTYSQSLYKQSEIDRDGQAVYKIFYHQTTATSQNDPVKVYMTHYSGDNLDAGWETLGNLIQVFDGNFGSPNAEGWVEITLDNPFVYNNTDNLIVGFLDDGDNAYMPEDGFFQSLSSENLSRSLTDDYSNIDPADASGGQLLAQRPNIRMVFGAPPTNPVFNLNLTSWDAGMTPGGMSNNSGDIFRITNIGGGTLTITDAVLLNGTEFSTSLIPGDVSLEGAEEYYFNFTYSPVDTGEDADTLIITHAEGTDTIFLSGHADYVLPENMIEIGQGTVTNVHLPMEPYYGYSYSQTIYLQNEINMEGMRISKVYYKKNNQDDWENAGDIHIYMGHTTLTEITDWVDISTLQEVKHSDVLPLPDTDGWVEFVLTVPFIYNNTDNLIVAFDENKPSYDNGSDEFYNHSVANDMSIYYYNDSNNPDPTSPPSGTTTSNRPNIRFQFEEMPTTPVMSINPDVYDYGTVIVSSPANKDFTVFNNGIGTLTINDIYLGGSNADQFILNNLPTFPVDQSNDYAEAFTFDVDFSPTTDGNMTAKLYIDNSEGLDSVILTGIGYDATIYSLPYSEYFDDPATTTVPEITLGWNALTNTTNSYAGIKSYEGNSESTPNTIQFYNSGDNSSEYMLAAPPTSLDPNGTRIRFYAYGTSSDQIAVGYFTDQNDLGTFVPVDTVDLTYDMTPYTVDMSSATPTGTWYPGFRILFAYTYSYIYIDNVIWEEIPTTPVFEATPNAIDFGDAPLMGTTDPETVTVTNVGIGNLIITDVAVTGTDATEFSINVIDDLNDTVTNALGDNLTVEASFSPTSAGIKTADIEFTDIDLNTYTVALTGNGVDVTMYPDTLVNFDDGVIPPPFWTEAAGMLTDTVVFSASSGSWISDDFSNDNVNYTSAARLNIWSTSTKDWLITTPIYLGDGTSPAILEFDLSTTPYSSSGEAGDAIDDRFAVLILPEGETEWLEANVLRMYDNEESAFVYDDIPNGDGEHVELSLGAYSGYVKIALYGESTVSNADNNLFVDNFEVRIMTPEEIALNETVEGTSIVATPEFINFEEGIDEERVLDYAVDFPTPMDANLNALLLHDYMLEFGTVLPTGVTVDVEFDDVNMGQIVSDGTQTSYWISDVISVARPALSSMLDHTVTLKVNGLVDIGSYDFTLSSYAALDGEFDNASTRTLLADETATLNVTPTPVSLPVQEDFESGLPTNWVISNNGTNSADWAFVNDGALSSTTGDNGYMQVDDFNAGADAITNADLMTASIDMSSVTGNVMLEFEHHYDHFTTDSATVMISIDNGMSWEVIEMFDADQGAMDVPTFESYDITSYAAGEGNVIIRWNFNDGGAQTFDWNIDDVHIYEYIPSTEAEFLTFEITGQVSSDINSASATIDVVMPNGTDLTALIPTFTLSDGAEVAISGVPQVSGTTSVDFDGSATTPVIYTVTAEDGTTSKDWNVTVSTETAIGTDGEFNFAVYPNPSNGQFDLNVYSENGFTYSIYTTDGKILTEGAVDANGEYVETINLKDVASGVYTLKVTADDVVKIEKLIIK